MKYLDIETDIRRDKLVAVCIDGQVYERRKVGDEALRALFESIKDEVIVAHYARFDVKQIYREFGVLFTKVWDTWAAAKILRNGMKNKDGSPVSNALVDVLYYFLGKRSEVHGDKATLQKGFSIMRDLTPREVEYIKADVADLPELQRVLSDRIISAGMEFVMKEEMALLPILIKKEVKGVRIDTPKLQHLVNVWKRGRHIAVNMLDREIARLSQSSTSGRPMLFVTYNYASTKQISQIFRDFNLPVPTKKERQKDGRITVKESNDEDALMEYTYEHPKSPMRRFIDIYLWFKEIDKLISTYGETMMVLIDENGYLHTEYNQLGAETGRLSSSNINMQNLPAHGNGAKVRNCFIPDEGEVFVDTDLDGAEIRIAADLSNDPLLVSAIVDGADMHSELASVTYSVLAGSSVTITKTKTPLLVNGHKLIPAAVRDKNKSTHFSLFYLGGAERIYTIIGDDVRKFRPDDPKTACKEIHTALSAKLHHLISWLKGKVTEATTRGILKVPKSGRVRYFNENAYGDAANFTIQAICAEAIKVAMIRMDKWLTETGKGRLVINVHDQLLTSCKPTVADEVFSKQAEVMSDSLGYFLSNIPGKATGKVTTKWEK